MLQELENYLVDKIAIALSGVNVSAWPDDPDESPAAKTSTKDRKSTRLNSSH